jgi:hypothetical protein
VVLGKFGWKLARLVEANDLIRGWDRCQSHSRVADKE